MQRFCDGDARAFDALFGRYAKSVHGYLTRLLGDPAAAEDMTQATFLSLVKSRGRFIRGAALRPWLYAIATNAARDHARRLRKPEELTPEGELPHDAAQDPPPLADAGLEKAVRKALDLLPQNQRECILLHRFEGLSFAEVAEAVGASEGAVKVRAHRGYERLRELLKGVWEESEP